MLKGRRDWRKKKIKLLSRDALIADKQKIKRSQEEARELQRKREEIEKEGRFVKDQRCFTKELELLSKNLAEAKKKSEQLAELKARKGGCCIPC